MKEYPAIREKKRRPTHPGSVLREDVLPALGLTITRAAELLDVSRQALHRAANEYLTGQRGLMGSSSAAGFDRERHTRTIVEPRLRGRHRYWEPVQKTLGREANSGEG